MSCLGRLFSLFDYKLLLCPLITLSHLDKRMKELRRGEEGTKSRPEKGKIMVEFLCILLAYELFLS